MNKEKKYIEPEIVKDGFKKAEKFGEEKVDMMGDQIKSIKKAILLKGISSLVLPLLIFILVIVGIVSLIMWIFANPFDYIVSGIFLFLILSPIYKIIKMFK